MYKILSKKYLNDTVVQMEIESPLVAKKARPGQFIILRVNTEGERIPLTVAGSDVKTGAVKIIFQIVGATTKLLSVKNAGEYIQDFVGPLGVSTHTEGYKKVCIIGGGVGSAIALPVCEEFYKQGADVTVITGFRNKELVILEKEFKSFSNNFILTTDDGSYGESGNVTMPLKRLIESGEKFDLIMAVGPLVMMKYVVITAKPYNIPVTVSMNPIMIDGTGMCGGCRLTLEKDGKRIMKFACVDGPDFNGYEVDFDEAITRNNMYAEFERHTYENTCNLLKEGENGN